MRFSTTLRLCIASAAFMLSLPSVAASHEPTAKAPAKRTQAGAGRSAKTVAAIPMATTVALPAEGPAAPQVVVLTGVVLLADGQPCPGASVFMSGAPRQLVVTDARGAFALPVPAGSPLAIQADYFGVGSTRLALNKPSGQPLRLVFGH